MTPELCQSECENCGEVFPDDALDPIPDQPGGECPDCGCLCQPLPVPIDAPPRR